jgi:hypothetical protein
VRTRFLSILAASLLLGACAAAPRGGSPSPAAGRDPRLAIVDKARWSMSAHNMQPWEVLLDPAEASSFRVHAAGARLLPQADPPARQTLMSIGGFLAVVEDAAAASGYRARIDLFPGGEPPAFDLGPDFTSPVAVVHLEPAASSPAPEYLDALGGATVKAGLGQLALDARQQADLQQLGSFPGIAVDFLTGEQDLARLKPLLKEAFRLEMTHPPTLEESYTLMRRNARQIARTPWGLSYRSSFAKKSLGAIQLFETLFPMKPAKWGLAGADSYDREIDGARTFLLVRTSGNSRTAQVQAGMVFQRLWLRAIHDGLAFVPASQPLQEYPAMAGLYRSVHQGFAEAGETIQMIAAVGAASPGFAAGFRIPTDELVRP